MKIIIIIVLLNYHSPKRRPEKKIMIINKQAPAKGSENESSGANLQI